MSGSYNLRSLQRKKDISVRTCHLHNFTGNRSPESFNPKVCLERLKLLECHDIQNSKFYLKNGRIIMKQNKSFFSSGKVLLKILCIVIVVITSIYWKDYVQSNSKDFIKKCSEVYPTILKQYSAAVKFHRSILKQFNYSQPKPRSENKKSKPVITKENVEVKDMIRDYFSEVKKKNKNENTLKSSYSFIEEQCRTYVKEGSSSAKKKNIYNTTLLDMENLTDYALESQGAKIVTAYDTQLYGTIAVKIFNFNLWPGFSHFLVKYLKGFNLKGPNSILMPWKKPGDCWAFKGSRGRVQIELSGKIIITAVSIDHIPKEITPEGNVESAPKEFSIFGVEESGNHVNKTYLGSYEYKTTGPSTQTFRVQPRVEIPFRRLELVVQSNHGNEKYTCIYKIRVHGLNWCVISIQTSRQAKVFIQTFQEVDAIHIIHQLLDCLSEYFCLSVSMNGNNASDTFFKEK